MTHLYLIRHGANIDGLEDGKMRDLGLSPEGIEQSEKLRDRLLKSGELKPDIFIASPERRAHESAKIIAPAFDVPMLLDKDVEEWRSDDGSLDPADFMERWRQTPENQKPFYRWIEGCENWVEFSLRVQQALNRICTQHAGKTIVIVSHGGVIQVSLYYFFGMGLATFSYGSSEMKNTSLTHWYLRENSTKWVLERFNDFQHLS